MGSSWKYDKGEFLLLFSQKIPLIIVDYFVKLSLSGVGSLR